MRYRDCFIEGLFVEVGEGVVEVVYGSTENAYVIGVTQVGDESSLGRLIFEIATEINIYSSQKCLGKDMGGV